MHFQACVLKEHAAIYYLRVEASEATSVMRSILGIARQHLSARYVMTVDTYLGPSISANGGARPKVWVPLKRLRAAHKYLLPTVAILYPNSRVASTSYCFVVVVVAFYR
jgi:hypothetical protein